MRLIQTLIIVTLASTIVGCRAQQPSQNPSGHSGAGPSPVAHPSRPSLPPPGKPVVGTKPPMPSPVMRPTLDNYKVETYASGLVVPWDIAFVSKNRAYVTERPGRVRLIENGRLQPRPYATISAAVSGEGGLMGIALHPNYPNPRWVYLMYTASDGNRISRFTDTGSGLSNEVIIVRGIPSAMYHDGGIIRFGPDGMLYIGTGDERHPERAQDRSSLNGKILRVTPDGKVPSDNPFRGSLVYAYGLRNVQGLAWNPANGDLWATNHGPSGELGLEGHDSVFIIRKGANYGWPRTLGVTNYSSVVPPVLFFPEPGVPPAGALFYTGSLMPELRGNFFFASLREEHLQHVVLSGPQTISRIERWWQIGENEGQYGRLRAVVQGPDGAIYVTTSNRDGRGRVRPGDDKILRISPR